MSGTVFAHLLLSLGPCSEDRLSALLGEQLDQLAHQAAPSLEKLGLHLRRQRSEHDGTVYWGLVADVPAIKFQGPALKLVQALLSSMLDNRGRISRGAVAQLRNQMRIDALELQRLLRTLELEGWIVEDGKDEIVLGPKAYLDLQDELRAFHEASPGKVGKCQLCSSYALNAFWCSDVECAEFGSAIHLHCAQALRKPEEPFEEPICRTCNVSKMRHADK